MKFSSGVLVVRHMVEVLLWGAGSKAKFSFPLLSQAVDRLVSAHPLQDVPPDFTVKVLNLILTKIDHSGVFVT